MWGVMWGVASRLRRSPATLPWVDYGRFRQNEVDYVMGRLIQGYQESADFYLRVADEVAEGIGWELAEWLVGSVSADGR